jgi:hypothetical protein
MNGGAAKGTDDFREDACGAALRRMSLMAGAIIFSTFSCRVTARQHAREAQNPLSHAAIFES